VQTVNIIFKEWKRKPPARFDFGSENFNHGGHGGHGENKKVIRDQGKKDIHGMQGVHPLQFFPRVPSVPRGSTLDERLQYELPCHRNVL